MGENPYAPSELKKMLAIILKPVIIKIEVKKWHIPKKYQSSHID